MKRQRKSRPANPAIKIPKRKLTELLEFLRLGAQFGPACHAIGFYQIEVFEHAKRDRPFKIELTKAVEAGKMADKCQLWLGLMHLGYKSRTAQRLAGINGTLLGERKKVDPDFALDALEAENFGTDYLEDIARQRGINGSDTLLMFTLKARDPQRFRDSPPATSITNNTLNLKVESRYELGRRLAFALRWAASGEAAGAGEQRGSDTQGPQVDTERGATNGSVPVAR